MELEKFKELMGQAIEIRDAEEHINKAMAELDSDFNCFSLGKCESLFLNTMAEAMNDVDGYIDWWICEKDWGRDKKMKVYDRDNLELKSKTLTDLYYLIKDKI